MADEFYLVQVRESPRKWRTVHNKEITESNEAREKLRIERAENPDQKFRLVYCRVSKA